MTVKGLIKILKTMPNNAIIVSDDGTGWLAKVRDCDVYTENNDNFVVIAGNGESV